MGGTHNKKNKEGSKKVSIQHHTKQGTLRERDCFVSVTSFNKVPMNWEK